MQNELRQRHVPNAQNTSAVEENKPKERGDICERLSRWMQNTSYQVMAYTFWDPLISGFKPGRIKAMQLLGIQPSDHILLIGEGSGLDFECLPDTANKMQIMALDFSSEMVRQSKIKAKRLGIPEKNCFVADAQQLPFTTEKFDKIFFPLSLGSIPNPTLALQEAERVLAPGGKIVVFEKLVDDEAMVSLGRRALNFFTKATFADINRNLSKMLGENSPLKITHYDSLGGKLENYAYYLGDYYRLAVLVRHADYQAEPPLPAKLFPR